MLEVERHIQQVDGGDRDEVCGACGEMSRERLGSRGDRVAPSRRNARVRVLICVYLSFMTRTRCCLCARCQVHRGE